MPGVFSRDQAQGCEQRGHRAEADNPERHRVWKATELDVADDRPTAETRSSPAPIPATSGTKYTRMPGRNIAGKPIGRV